MTNDRPWIESAWAKSMVNGTGADEQLVDLSLSDRNAVRFAPRARRSMPMAAPNAVAPFSSDRTILLSIDVSTHRKRFHPKQRKSSLYSLR